MKNYILCAILSAFIISCGQSKAKQQQEAINDMVEKYSDRSTADTAIAQRTRRILQTAKRP